MTKKTSTEEMLKAALKLAERWTIFPAPPGTKKSHKKAEFSGGRMWGKTKDRDEIKRDWARWPEANVGIPTGKENGFWVMEIDTLAGGHADDGERSLTELVQQHAPLPLTLMARSPSGSVHYYWKWPDDDGFEIRNTAGVIGPGIDTRGEDGMVIAPPSNRGDGCYEFLNWGTWPIPAPAWLVEKARMATKGRSRTTTAAEPRTNSHCDLDKLASALKELPNPIPEFSREEADDLGLQGGWENWNKVGMAIYAATGGTSVGLKLFKGWSEKNADKYNEANTDDKWKKKFRESPPTDIGFAWLYKLVRRINPSWDRISFDHFYAHLPSGKFLFLPLMTFWPAESVDNALPPVEIVGADGKVKKVRPRIHLAKTKPLHETTWQPGMPTIIPNKLFTTEGVWIDQIGTNAFNNYKAPTLIPGDAKRAGPWLDVVDKVVGENRDHVVSWFAHRVQKPHEKINHVLVVGGAPGIGKDSMIEPLSRSVGSNNFAEIEPSRFLDRWNYFLKSVVLRISEARDLGDVNRYAFYEALKRYAAAPPPTIDIEEKYQPAYPVPNVTGIIITTNYKNGLYLHPEDRRTFVSWSDANVADIPKTYFDEYWHWLNHGGDRDVLAYLRDHDLSKFDAKATPPKTEAFLEMVDTGIPDEAADVDRIINSERVIIHPGNGYYLGSPDAFSVSLFKNAIPNTHDLRDWVEKNKKQLPYRFAEAGYVPIRNDKDKKRGRWGPDKLTIYAKASLTRKQQIRAAEEVLKDPDFAKRDSRATNGSAPSLPVGDDGEIDYDELMRREAGTGIRDGRGR